MMKDSLIQNNMPRMAATTLLLTVLALFAFAGNSLLSRAAFTLSNIDANSFTLIRLCAGALTLFMLVQLQHGTGKPSGGWLGATLLFAYAILFSYAYLQLDTATGALLLFAAVQLTMLVQSLRRRESVSWLQWFGAVLALIGLVYLLLPGANAPALTGAMLMLGAGIAWGLYSLLGQRAGPALLVTAGNFYRSVPLAVLLLVWHWPQVSWDGLGVLLAVLSGALTSGVGYAVWYRVLPSLSAMQAASVQLAVPVVAAGLGVALLAEPLSSRLFYAGILVMLGLALILKKPRMRL